MGIQVYRYIVIYLNVMAVYRYIQVYTYISIQVYVFISMQVYKYLSIQTRHAMPVKAVRRPQWFTAPPDRPPGRQWLGRMAPTLGEARRRGFTKCC